MCSESRLLDTVLVSGNRPNVKLNNLDIFDNLSNQERHNSNDVISENVFKHLFLAAKTQLNKS